MKCVICGKHEAYMPLNHFCPSCYMINHPLLPQTTSEPSLQVPFCNFCAQLKIGRKWYPLEDSSTLESLKIELSHVLELQNDITLRIQLTNIEYSASGIPHLLNIHLTAERQLAPVDQFQQEQQEFVIELVVSPCRQCMKFQSAHYEAVLQIRADQRKLESEEAQWISQQLIEQTNKAAEKNANVYISKLEERPEGLNFYFSAASLALRLARELADSTAAHLQVSYKLVSAHPSLKHPIKRATIRLRLPSYHIGDFVSFRLKSSESSEVVQILAFTRGMVQYHSYRNNIKASDPVKQFNERNPFVMASALQIRPFLIIAHLDDSVQVMDSLTYRTFEILKNHLEPHINPGESINAILIDGAVYVSFYLPEPALTS